MLTSGTLQVSFQVLLADKSWRCAAVSGDFSLLILRWMFHSSCTCGVRQPERSWLKIKPCSNCNLRLSHQQTEKAPAARRAAELKLLFQISGFSKFLIWTFKLTLIGHSIKASHTSLDYSVGVASAVSGAFKYLGDDQRLSVLGASPHGEAPGRFPSEQHLHQLFLLLLFLLILIVLLLFPLLTRASPLVHLPPPLHPPRWNSQVVSVVHGFHGASGSGGSINKTPLIIFQLDFISNIQRVWMPVKFHWELQRLDYRLIITKIMWSYFNNWLITNISVIFQQYLLVF